jgi:hypothetical protein
VALPISLMNSRRFTLNQNVGAFVA